MSAEDCQGCPSGIIGDSYGEGVGRCYLVRSIAKRYYDDNDLRRISVAKAKNHTISEGYIEEISSDLETGFKEHYNGSKSRYAEWIRTDSRIASVALKALIESGDLSGIARCSTQWLVACVSEQTEPMNRNFSSTILTILDVESFWGISHECIDFRRF